MERQTRHFQSINEVPPILQSVFYIELGENDYQIVYGLSQNNLTKICSDKPYHRAEEPWAVRYNQYRFRILETYPFLTPYTPLSIHDANRLNITIAMMGNKSLIPNALRLRYRDFSSIYNLSFPGKSASIDFTNVHNKQNDSERREAINLYFNAVGQKDADRTDALHVTTVDHLQQNGFVPYLAPIKNHPLHVRICDVNIIDRHIKGEYITEEDKMNSAERLANLWEAYY